MRPFRPQRFPAETYPPALGRPPAGRPQQEKAGAEEYSSARNQCKDRSIQVNNGGTNVVRTGSDLTKEQQYDGDGVEPYYAGDLLPAYPVEGKSAEQTADTHYRQPVGKDRGRRQDIIHRVLSVSSLQRCLLFSERGAVAPEKEERVGQEQVAVAAQQAESRVDKVIREVIRMAYDGINPFRAQDLVPYKRPLRQEMQEGPEDEKKCSKEYLRFRDGKEQRRACTEEYNDIAKNPSRQEPPAQVDTSWCEVTIPFDCFFSAGLRERTPMPTGIPSASPFSASSSCNRYLYDRRSAALVATWCRLSLLCPSPRAGSTPFLGAGNKAGNIDEERVCRPETLYTLTQIAAARFGSVGREDTA